MGKCTVELSQEDLITSSTTLWKLHQVIGIRNIEGNRNKMIFIIEKKNIMFINTFVTGGPDHLIYNIVETAPGCRHDS